MVCFETLLRIDAHASGEKSQPQNGSTTQETIVRSIFNLISPQTFNCNYGSHINKQIANVLVRVDPVGDGEPVVGLGGWAVNWVIVLGKHHQSGPQQMREKKRKERCEEKRGKKTQGENGR